ncbi:MAG: hypothetical protein HY074_05270 [Deltaproteobacteria bacterium]|nr:hypothetical protein [Deltaproteobacteria bacterium]
MILHLMLAVGLAHAAPAPKWSIETVDRSSNGNRQIAIKATADGQVHLAYTGCTDAPCKNDELRYTVRGLDGKWATSTVDNAKNATGWVPSMAFDANGTIHLVYANHYKYPRLQYAYKTQNSPWKTQTVGNVSGGYWTSLAVSGENIYVANTVFPKNDVNQSALQIATKVGDAWTFEVIDDSMSAGWFTQLVIGADGLPIVTSTATAYPNGDLKLMRKTANGTWETTAIADQTIKNSLALDSKGFIHIAFNRMDDKFMKTSDLMYATNAPDGAWTMQLIEGGEYSQQDTGGFPYLVLDSKDRPHVSYSDKFHRKLMYARNLGGKWEIYALTKNKDDCYYSRMDLDAKGGLHLACDTGDTIRYAYCKDCTK